MKRILTAILTTVLAAASVLAGTKTVLVVSSPTVDKQIARETYDFMTRNVRGALRYQDTLFKVAGFGPEEQLKIFAAMRTENDPLVVALVNDASSKCSPVILSQSQGAAVVNIAPFLNDKSLSKKEQRALIDRSMMYALGRAAGMDACLNPYCALSEYKMMKDRVIGRNYCPKCTDEVAAKLKSLGIVEKPVKRPVKK